MFHIPAHKSATAAQVIYPDWAEGLETSDPVDWGDPYPDPTDLEEIRAEEWERAFYSNEESREG